MNNFISNDIFFFLTSIAVVACTVCIIVVTVYIVRILRNVKDLSETVRDEGKKITADIDLARQTVKSEGAKAISIFDSVLGILRIKKFTKKKNNPK